MPDTYKSMTDLLQRHPNKGDYRIDRVPRDSTVAVLAPHGGNIEPGTTEIARAIATDQYNFYSFESLVDEKASEVLHVTSTHYDEPVCRSLIGSCDTVIAVHGAGSLASGRSVYVGGLDQKLRDTIATQLGALAWKAKAGEPPETKITVNVVKQPGEKYAGRDPANICNQGRARSSDGGRGVQLEFSRTLRDELAEGAGADTNLSALAAAVRRAVEQNAAEAKAADETEVGTKGVATKTAGTGDGWGIARMFGLQSSTNGADDCLTVDQLKALRARTVGKEVPDAIAEELSAALGLGQVIRSRNIYIEGAADRLGYIVDCLLAAKPQLILASDSRLRLQVEVYAKSGIISRTLAHISSGSSTGLVLSALVTSLVTWLFVLILVRLIIKHVHSDTAHDMFFMNGKALAVIVSAAFAGGVISIATRLREFSRVRDLDPFAMFWTALLKPLIGVVLAMFILATLAGGIISFGFLDQDPFRLNATGAPADPPLALKTLYVLWVLGFLAGFSERFAWDFVDRAQGVASAAPAADHR